MPDRSVVLYMPRRFRTAGEGTTVTQRRWSETHAAGVAPGSSPIDHSFLEIDGHTFAKMSVGKGKTEILLEP